MKSLSFSITIAFKGKEHFPSLIKCIESFYNQSFLPKEIILIGNENDLSGIDKRLPDKRQCELIKIFVNVGKNEARNIGIKACTGDYILYIDHDMTAGKNLLLRCQKICSSYDVLFILEKRTRGNFWGNCRRLEKEIIKNDLDTISPRFFRKGIFKKGDEPFNKEFGELDEWGFNLQIKKKGSKAGVLTGAFLTVHENKLNIFFEMKRKFVRGMWLRNMIKKDSNEAWRRTNPFKKGILLYSKRINYLFIDPIHFVGLIILKTIDYLSFISGYLFSFCIN